MLDQIRNDHQNAKQLAEGIDEIEGLFVDKKNIKSNILYFDIERGKSRCDELDSQTQDIDIYPFEINLDGVRFFESRFRILLCYCFQYYNFHLDFLVFLWYLKSHLI